MINIENVGILKDIEKGIYILEKIPHDCLDDCPIFNKVNFLCNHSELCLTTNGIDNLMLNCPIRKFPKKQSIKSFNEYVPEKIKKEFISYFEGYNDCLDDIAEISQKK